MKSSKNQIETILKCKNKISNNLPILVLNPDSLFKFEKKISKLKNQFKKDEIIFFGIKDYERHINVSDKDTFNILDRNISLIKIKKGIPDNKKKFVSAGLYYFKNLKLFEELNKKSIQKNLFDKSNYQIGHLMKNSLQHQNISYSFVNNFVDLGNNKKLEEYFFWLKFFKNKFFLKTHLKQKNPQHNTSCRRRK